MNSSIAILAVWLAWMVGVATLAFWRYGVVQKDKREREEHRRERKQQRRGSDDQGEREFDSDEPQKVQPLGAEYREQLIAAGLLKPAIEQPDSEQSA